jgi:hypothetical protein
MSEDCSVCGAPGLLIPLGHSSACPTCSTQSNAEIAAYDHLQRLLRPVLRAWAGGWAEAGLSDDTLRALLELEGASWANEDPLGTDPQTVN